MKLHLPATLRSALLACLAAASVFSTAMATDYTSALSGSGTGNGNYTAWTFTWGTSSALSTTDSSGESATLADTVYLTSITVNSATGSFSGTGDVKLAVYASSNSSSASSDWTTDVTNWTLAGLSTNSTGSWTASTEYTFTYDGDVTLTSGTRYYFVFVDASETEESLTEALESETYSGTTWRVAVISGTGTDSRVYSSSSSGSYNTSYSVDATFSTTDEAASAGTTTTVGSYQFNSDGGSGISSVSFEVADGITGTMSISSGAFWWGNSSTTWTNTAALDAMNAELGTSFTADYMNGMLASGNGATSTLTLNFDSATYSSGDSVVLYLTVGARDTDLSSLTLTGLESMSITYATDTGDGFVSDATYSTSGGTGTNAITLIRVEGALTSALTVTLTSSTAKNGVGLVALSVESASWTWTASSGTTWTDGSSAEWDDGTSSNTPSGQAVHFTAAGTGDVTIDSGGVNPGSITVSSGSHAFVGEGGITTSSLTVSGGSLSIENSGNDIAAATVSGGSLVLSVADALSAADDGTTVTLSGGTLELAADDALSGTDAISITKASTILYDTAGVTTDISGLVAASSAVLTVKVTDADDTVTWTDADGINEVLDGGLTKSGDGTLALSSAEALAGAGDITVNAGALTFDATTSIGSADAASAVSVASGATLTISAASPTLYADITGSGDVVLGTSDSNIGAATVSGDNSAFAGTLTVHGGTGSAMSGDNANYVAFGSAASMGGASTKLVLDSVLFEVTSGTDIAVSTGSITLSGTNRLRGTAGDSYTFSGDLSGDGTLILFYGSEETPGSATFAGSLAGLSGTLSAGGNVVGVYTLTGDAYSSGYSIFGEGATLTVVNGSEATYVFDYDVDELEMNATVTNGANLTQAGAGTLKLTKANTSEGALTASSGTVLIASSASWAGAVSVASGATLSLEGGAATGDVTLASGATLTTTATSASAADVGDLTLASGSSLTLTKTGSDDTAAAITADSLSAAGTVSLTVSGLTAISSDTTIYLITSAAALASDIADSFSLTLSSDMVAGVSYETASVAVSDDGYSLVLTLTATESWIWADQSGTWSTHASDTPGAWSDKTRDDGTPDGHTVVFSGDGDTVYIDGSATVEPANIHVLKGDYTFTNFDAMAAAITCDGELTVAEGASLTIANTGATNIGSVENDGTLTVSTNATLCTSEMTNDGDLIISDGLVIVDSLESSGTISGTNAVLDVVDGVISGDLSGDGTLYVDGGTTFAPGISYGDWGVANYGTATFNQVGADGETATLTLSSLTLADGSTTNLTFNSDSSATVLSLGTLTVQDGAAVTITSTGEVVLSEDTYTLGTVSDAANSSIGDAEVTLAGVAFKYYESASLSLEDGSIVLNLERVEENVYSAVTDNVNSAAGATLLWAATGTAALGESSDLYQADAAVQAAVNSGSATEANRLMAAVAGSGVSVLGSALAGDVERQLRAIRNRTTSMGVNPCVVNEEMPYFNAWINAEGDYRKVDAEGLLPGYELTSWGGTVGFDVDFNEHVTAGLALTAMYGDLDTDSVDLASGDLDTYYVSLFARVCHHRWTHTFVGTVGRMDGNLKRTVDYGSGSYRTDGDTDGTAVGLLYELGYTIPLNEDATSCLQPIVNVAWRYAHVGGYSETGSDAGLRADGQSYNVVTFGAGVRAQTLMGQNTYNRSSLLEARALLKVDAGDRRGEAEVALLNGSATRAKVKSAEIGAVGLEAGVGVSVPIDEDAGSIFIDASIDLRNNYTSVNGVIGYRINF